MANVFINGWGVGLELTTADVSALEEAIKTGLDLSEKIKEVIKEALDAAKAAAPLAGLVMAVLTAYVAIEMAIIKAVDKGNGVYLTLPWPAIYFGQLYLIIPGTRPPSIPQPPLDWSNNALGSFGTNDIVDVINYVIEYNVAAADGVEFQLINGTDSNNSSGWKKILVMPDGQGSQWDLVAEGRGSSAMNSLWASQVLNGQVLTFKKAKAFGVMTDVLQLGNLQNLVGGSRVTFTWSKDQ